MSRGLRQGPILTNLFPCHYRGLKWPHFYTMDTPLYFAYGSNMLRSRIEFRVGYAEKVSNCTIYGYKLVFNVNEAYANIEKGKEGDIVEGVLYKLTDRQIATLDEYEGYPRVYQRRCFLFNGKICYLYLAENPWCNRAKPTFDYFNKLLEGAKENNLIKTVKKLEQLKKDLKIRKVQRFRGGGSPYRAW